MPTNNLGKPCWKKENVSKAISPIAQLERVNYFLASHSPIQEIRNDETKELLSEEEFFQEVIVKSQGEVLALVHGDPGTGKSHLIHWLKLRCEDELERGNIRNFVPVLIQRRTGSLKDALEQMIEQLPSGFEKYLDPVKKAIDSITDSTARTKLSQTLFLELSDSDIRAERGRSKIDGLLKDLPEFCSSPGTREWLCREGGTIDKNIKQLIEVQDPEELDSYPEFSATEFSITDPSKRSNNTQDIGFLIEELDDDRDLREKAAGLFNEVLTDAIREMTGLSNTQLKDIFDQIRADLKNEGKELVLFIEDVSVMSALDEEVFVAVEPVNRKNLCRMIAIIGLTNKGWNRLRDNQKDRITYSASVGEEMIEKWMEDSKSLAEFSARYLNSVRLGEEEISKVADARRDGEDISISACLECAVREKCHSIFGKVTIDQLDIGMFPFTISAPHRLLTNLIADSELGTDPNPTPRKLLTKILYFALDKGFDLLETDDFPDSKLFPVELPVNPFWQEFVVQYCGNWTPGDKNRVKFLAQAWFDLPDAKTAAEVIEPFLKPFGLPPFSSYVEARKVKTVEEPKENEIKKIVKPHPVSDTDRSKLQKLLKNLDKWVQGEKLINDQFFRKLVADFLRKSIPWDDEKFPPLKIYKDLMRSGYSMINIEGMRASVGNKFLINFKRNQETRDLLEALVQFDLAGKGAWNFSGSEIHKRTLAHWLRKNRDGVIRHLQPKAGLDTAKPVETAVQFLTISAMLHQRKQLPTQPKDAPELLGILLAKVDSNVPSVVSEGMNKLLFDIRAKQPKIKEFLLNELYVPQSRSSAKISYIDPLPILRAATDFVKTSNFQFLPDEYQESFWESRYAELGKLRNYKEFPKTVDDERKAIREIIDEIEFNLRAAGFKNDNLADSVTGYCSELIEVAEAAKNASIYSENEEFKTFDREKVYTERKDVWATAFKHSQKMVESKDDLATLRFDPSNLKEGMVALKVAFEFIDEIEKEVKQQLDFIGQQGDPLELKKSLIEALEDMGEGEFSEG